MPPLPPSYDSSDQLCAATLRMLAVDAIHQANSGHPGLPLGAADIVTVLWTRFLKHDPDHPAWANRDRFVLSAGHGSALLYALLHLSGYPLSLEELKNFRQWGAVTAGHPEFDPEIGIEVTTGPLGQGISNAVGMAMAERWLAARFNRPDFNLVDHHTYVLAGDGDLMEGVSHEAASLAGRLKLGKRIVYYDDNHISIDGNTKITLNDDALKRFEAYGWHTMRINGHDMAQIDAATKLARAETERPSIIACRTHIGLGSPLQDTAGVHGSPLKGDALIATRKYFNWPTDKPFYIPEEAQTRFNQVKEIGAAQRSRWETLLDQYRQQHPNLAAQWELMISGQLPKGWETNLPNFSGGKPNATRNTSGQVLDAITPHLPMLLGGSADLSGSNKTKAKSAVPLTPDDFSGNYIHYGVREHGMGAIMNGLAAHGGVRPFGGTFLVFADYLRPAIRMAAMMKLPVIYVFTHDSIGLGEDGPTHQPIETITSLRIIPNMVVIRPADGNESALAWKVALERKDGPTCLILTRQGLPQITPVDSDLAKGAYILSEGSGNPDVILIGTGSEVSLAMDAQKALAEEGVSARVVSMPSWELFDAQPADYRAAVLPPDTPKLAIETASTIAWPRYADDVIGLDHFGASAPYQTIFKEFGFTVENVVKRAKALK